MKGFTRIVRPITAMLKGSKWGQMLGPFKPTSKMQEVFQRIQSEFTKVPILSHFDYKEPNRQGKNTFGPAIAGIILQPTTWLT
jgi:hypothetical protein